jgi:hypothetical protein
MAKAKTYIGSDSGKTFISLTMGPKEAGSVIANLEAGPNNKNTQNVVAALRGTGKAKAYRAVAAQPARTTVVPAVAAALVPA